MSEIGTDTGISVEEDIYRTNLNRAERKLGAYEPSAAAAALKQAAEAARNLADLTVGARSETWRERSNRLQQESDGYERQGMDFVESSSIVEGTMNDEHAAVHSDGGSSMSSDDGQPHSSDPTSTREPESAGAPTEDDDAPTRVTVETPDLTFDDVGGMESLKERLWDRVAVPIVQRDHYRRYDVSPIEGVLLQGPPGTGKTHFTRALAGELGWSFIELRPSDVTSSLFGESAKNLREVFETAKTNAPAIVFFDEIDAIAPDRAASSNGTQSGHMMLTEWLQGSEELPPEVVLFAATNAPETVDDAITNSERIEEVVEVPLPDRDARKSILRVHLRKPQVPARDVDVDAAAELMEGFSAADIRSVAQGAARRAADEGLESESHVPIRHDHVEAAIEAKQRSNADAEGGGYL